MQANSTPTTLAPSTTRLRGRRCIASSPSEVTTPGRSVPRMGTGAATEPVATMMARAA